jgi:4a-hydroxytetrahydrobiopterin dehydratase
MFLSPKSATSKGDASPTPPSREVAGSSDARALTPLELDGLLGKLDDGWQVAFGHHLVRGFDFADFNAALEFVGKVSLLSEELGARPHISLGLERVEVALWTPSVDGLTDRDLALATAISDLL